MVDNIYIFLAILVCSLVTISLRFIPFWVFQNRELPKYICFLGNVLPFSAMAMLVVYCLRSLNFFDSPFAIPEITACIFVVMIHIYKRNTLLSIVGGTALYMLLIQVVVPNFI